MLKTLNKRLIAKPVEPEKKEGVLIIPTDERANKLYEVIAIDPDNEAGIKKGDKVIVDRYDAREHIIEDETHYFINIANVLAVWE